MQTEPIKDDVKTLDSSYKNEIVYKTTDKAREMKKMSDITIEDFSRKREIYFNPDITITNGRFKNKDQNFYWTTDYSLSSKLSEASKFNFVQEDGEDIIDFLMPLNESSFFYDWTNEDWNVYKRDFVFRKNDSNPYYNIAPLTFSFEYKPADVDCYYTFGIEELFDKIQRIQSRFMQYINSMFDKWFPGALDIVLKNIPKDIKNQLGKTIENNFKGNQLGYLILLNEKIKVLLGKDNMLDPSKIDALGLTADNIHSYFTFKNASYTDDVLSSMRSLILSSSKVTWYKSKMISPSEKQHYYYDDKDISYKKLMVEDAKVLPDIYFIDSKLNPSALFRDLNNGLLYGYGADKDLKILLHIFVVQNNMACHFNQLMEYITSQGSGLSADGKGILYDIELILCEKNKRCNYGIIKENLKNDEKEVSKIFANALKIKKAIELDLKPEEEYNHPIINLDPDKIKAGYMVLYYGSHNKTVDIDSINRNMSNGINALRYGANFTQDSYIGGKSVIFRYNDFDIILNECKELTSDKVSRIVFKNVYIAFGSHCIMLSNTENETYPYYICHYIHTKDEPKITSAVRLEFRPSLNENIDYGNILQGVKNFYALFNDLFRTTFFIRADLFTYQKIDITPVVKGDGVIKTTENDLEISYNLTNNHTVILNGVKKGEVTYTMDNLPTEFSKYTAVNDDDPEPVLLKGEAFEKELSGFEDNFMLDNEIGMEEDDGSDEMDFGIFGYSMYRRNKKQRKESKPKKSKKVEITKEDLLNADFQDQIQVDSSKKVEEPAKEIKKD